MNNGSVLVVKDLHVTWAARDVHIALKRVISDDELTAVSDVARTNPLTKHFGGFMSH